MDILIRRLQEKDIPCIAEYEKEISIISFGDEAITDIDFHARKIRKGYDKNNDGMFVLTVGDEISGWLWMDEKENYLTQEKYVNFRSFYISEKHRGGEEGTELMKRGMEYCREINAQSITGKVHVGNIPMRSLYKSFDFEATHITMEYKAPVQNAGEANTEE